MTCMAVNRVDIHRADGTTETLIDLTADTVTADKLAEGYTAHKADGSAVVGTAVFGGDVDYTEIINALAQI